MVGGEGREANYAGVYEGHLRPGNKPALLVVDMVEAYLEPISPLYCETARGALEVTNSLVNACHETQIPVVFTNVEYESGGADGGIFYKKAPVLKAFDRGSSLGAFPDDLQIAQSDTVITKQYPSAFFDTGLAEMLKSQQVDTLIICGYSTSGCVRASALDAMQHGFIPFVVRDACADRHADPHESNLFDLQAKYAEVVDNETAHKIIGAAKPA
ncbi:MAG TPA: isochorismatase [Erythrobacter sp.]|nr:isochorismatase [Erythrobacter sp.]